MKEILTNESFIEMMNSEQAIVFVHFPWAGTSQLSKRTIGEWDQSWSGDHLSLQIGRFCVESEKLPQSLNPLLEKVGERYGDGCVVWLKAGEVVGYVPFAHAAGVAQLVSVTERVFGSHSDSPTSESFPPIFPFIAPWHRIENLADATSLEFELRKELASSHPLFGKYVRAIALRSDCDDVFFQVGWPLEYFAVVHLTWSGKRETTAQWPSAEIFQTLQEFADRRMRLDSAGFDGDDA